MRRYLILLPIFLLMLLLSISVTKTSHSQDWPLFWPSSFNFPTGPRPSAVAIGDFNNDGDKDMAVANYGESGPWPENGNVTILLGGGNGFFTESSSNEVGISPESVAKGDFNGDGNEDLAVAHHEFGSNNVAVLLGKGDGSFGTASFFEAGYDPRSVSISDFDEDSHHDLAVACDNGVAILIGRGDGTFNQASFYPAGSSPRSVDIGDFDRDSHKDLAVASGSSGIAILLGRGDGSFETASFFEAGDYPYSVTIGDFNNDVNEDLAVSTSIPSDVVAILMGQGDGSFQEASFYAVGDYPKDLAVGDFNSDGNEDVATANNDSGDFAILMGRGDGSFQEASFYRAGNEPFSVAVGDFDEDGYEDLVGANHIAEVVILLAEGDGTFGEASFFEAGDGPEHVATGDFDSDGVEDLVVVNRISDDVTILMGRGNGSFFQASSYKVGDYPNSIAVGDFNGDDNKDLVTANANSNDVTILFGNGDGSFGSVSFYGVGQYPTSVAVGDFNRDDKRDLAVANHESNDIAVLMGLGDGSFIGPWFYIACNLGWYSTYSVAIGDFDGDGSEDLAVANTGGWEYAGFGNVAILMGQGNGSFQYPSFYGAGQNPRSVAVGDFDGDDNDDLAVANLGDSEFGYPANVAILMGHGNGTFGTASFFEAGDLPSSVIVGDFDGDSNQDLAGRSRGVFVLLGRGDGSFDLDSFYGAHGRPTVGEFDGDGYMDLAVATFSYDDITILMNSFKEIDVEINCSFDKIPQGWSLPFTVTVSNETDTTVTVDLTLWVKVVGGPEIPFFGPHSRTLQGGQEITRSPSVAVPDNAQLGDYIVSLEAKSLSDEVIDEDSFRVTVVGLVEKGASGKDEFKLEGW